ncbi:MAG: hypothetical protein IJ011_00315 [Clostridia bacterium]|nr:hypothetical protein [Clostridia bacterium]
MEGECIVIKYFDKNGAEIKAGMLLRMSDGSIERVFDTTDNDGNSDLGISATNEDYLRRHPDARREYYSLMSICLRNVEVCNDRT